MELQHVIDRAIEISKEEKCTQHVNATVRLTLEDNGKFEAKIRYDISDWFSSDATVYSATNGYGERTY